MASIVSATTAPRSSIRRIIWIVINAFTLLAPLGAIGLMAIAITWGLAGSLGAVVANEPSNLGTITAQTAILMVLAIGWYFAAHIVGLVNIWVMVRLFRRRPIMTRGLRAYLVLMGLNALMACILLWKFILGLLHHVY